MTTGSRLTDPDTSAEAAAMVSVYVPDIQRRILHILDVNPTGLSTRQMSQILAIDFATVSPRMKPMEKNGWVEMTSVKVKSPQGKGWGHVWVITPNGRTNITRI